MSASCADIGLYYGSTSKDCPNAQDAENAFTCTVVLSMSWNVQCYGRYAVELDLILSISTQHVKVSLSEDLIRSFVPFVSQDRLERPKPSKTKAQLELEDVQPMFGIRGGGKTSMQPPHSCRHLPYVGRFLFPHTGFGRGFAWYEYRHLPCLEASATLKLLTR